MFAPSLLAASAVLLVSALADDSSPYSKFIDDANSLLADATATGAANLDALYAWQATQTAVPTDDVESQYQDYLNAYMTATSAPLPSWVTAVPSSLQSVATSFLQAEASLVVQDIAPIVSQYNASVSASATTVQATPAETSSSNITATSTPAPSATASSGFSTAAANSTASQVSSIATNTLSTNATVTTPVAGGSPTNSVTPPAATFNNKNGAERQAGAGIIAMVVGVLGMIVLL